MSTKYDYNVLEKIRKSPETRINKGVSRLFALVAGIGCGCPVDTFAKQKHRPRRQPRPPTCFARLCRLPSCGARTHAHLKRGVLFDRCANPCSLYRPPDALATSPVTRTNLALSSNRVRCFLFCVNVLKYGFRCSIIKSCEYILL